MESFMDRDMPSELQANETEWQITSPEEFRTSEDKYRFLAENMSDVIWILDLNLQTTYVSPSIESVLGYSPEERYKQPVEEMMTASSLHKVGETLAAELQREKEGQAQPNRSVTIDVAYFHRNGHIVWMENRIKGLRNPEGELIGFYGISRDITERKKAEDALQDSVELFKTVFEQAAVGIAKVLPDGTFSQVNDKFAAMIGYEQEDLENIPFREITHPDDLHLDDHHIEQVMAGEIDSFEITKRYLHKDGHPVWIKLYSNAVRDKDGEIKYAVAVVVDITNQVKTEKALRESEEVKNLILNATSEIIVYYDLDLRVIWANRASAESVGKSMEELTGLHCYEIWHQRKEPCENCPVIKAREEKIPKQSKQQTPDGRHWSLRGYPILDDQEEMIALAEFTLDITERVEAEAERQRLLDKVIADANELERRVQERTEAYQKIIDLTADREVRMSDLKKVIKKLRAQLEQAGLEPVAIDPLMERLD
jgi:PAS domain S-box-containing protein